MFAYCNNSPVCYSDSTGTRIDIWPTLFEDHDPGYIHREVQKHIIGTGLLFKKELYLAGIGRADIFDPDTFEIWEIKHGGSSTETQMSRIESARIQVNNYISKYTDGQLIVGHEDAFTGAFILNCGQVSYAISYETPAPGVILYYVQELRTYEPAASFAYVPKENKHYNCGGTMMPLVCLGVSSCLLSMVSRKQLAG